MCSNQVWVGLLCQNAQN
uniref:Uncharacterized protein n=1 Tax=Anguilla anguilla TaxID=7936 RepID=A0A0E9P516_ANGAN